MDEAIAVHDGAVDAARDAEARLAAAKAAVALVPAEGAVRTAAAGLADAREAAASARREQGIAQDGRDRARAMYATARSGLDLARGRVAAARDAAKQTEERIRGIHEAITKENEQYWRRAWGSDDPATARSALAGDARVRGVAMTAEASYRKTATETLAEVLGALDLTRPEAAPTSAIAAGIRDRADPARSTLSETTERLLDAMQVWLAETAELDEMNTERITEDRGDRLVGIESSSEACAACVGALRVIQDAIARSVSTRLEAVAAELDRLNRASGGHGAELGIEVVPPAGPEDSWRWEVEPRWRRGPGARMLNYRAITNAAKAKLFSVHLVVAALFASGEAHGSVLILDELGNSLGSQHRREVLKALAAVAAQEGITVFGTCQDDLLVKASEVCGEAIVFERKSASDVMNAPVRVWGYDANRNRVELIADDHQVVPLGNVRQSMHISEGQDVAGWVSRRDRYDHAGARGDGSLEPRPVDRVATHGPLLILDYFSESIPESIEPII